MAKRTTRDINSAIESSYSRGKRSRDPAKDLSSSENEKREERLYKLKIYYLKKYKKDSTKSEEDAYKTAEKQAKALEKHKQALLNTDTKRTKKEAEEIHKLKMEQLEEEWDAAATYEERLAAEKKINQEEQSEAMRKYAEEAKEALSNSLGAALNAAFDWADSGVSSGVEIYSKYMSGIDARLQGSTESFEDMLKTVKNNLAVSPYLKMSDLLENIDELVAQGIAYNVEQRAFLETVSDKIATTFDATNGVLLRLIRIQQADTTAARLGLEANLTRYLNSTYEDTSYLSDQFDNVSSALYEATSIAGRNVGVELEYVVQKWLGSLYSVGASDTLISNLSTAIGYLGSGNLSALASDEAMQNLLVMATSRSGYSGPSYSEILSSGLSASAANELLKSVVSYVQEIASSDNLVVKSQYAEIFGMTISDMTALLNLSTQDLDSIASNMLSYADTIDEVTYQLTQVASRTHISELIDNVVENAALTLGLNVASNAVSYGLYKVGDVIDTLTGNLKLPTVSVLGNSVNLDMTYGQVLKTGIIGISAIPTLINAVNSIANSGGLSLSSWDWDEYTTRGSGLTSTSYGTYTGVSSSAIMGNTSSTEAISQSITSAKEEATSVTGEEPEDDTVDNIEQNTFDIVDALSEINSSINSIYSSLANQGYYGNSKTSGVYSASSDANAFGKSVTSSAEGNVTGTESSPEEVLSQNISNILRSITSIENLLNTVSSSGTAFKVNSLYSGSTL